MHRAIESYDMKLLDTILMIQKWKHQLAVENLDRSRQLRLWRLCPPFCNKMRKHEASEVNRARYACDDLTIRSATKCESTSIRMQTRTTFEVKQQITQNTNRRRRKEKQLKQSRLKALNLIAKRLTLNDWLRKTSIRWKEAMGTKQHPLGRRSATKCLFRKHASNGHANDRSPEKAGRTAGRAPL